jgi:hypothetical protein
MSSTGSIFSSFDLSEQPLCSLQYLFADTASRELVVWIVKPADSDRACHIAMEDESVSLNVVGEKLYCSRKMIRRLTKVSAIRDDC